MLIGLIILLVCIIIGLVIYNMSIHNKIQAFKTQSRRFQSLNILQDFMNIVGNDMPVEKKIKAINEVIVKLNILQLLFLMVQIMLLKQLM